MSCFRDGNTRPDLVRPARWRELLNCIWPRYVVVVYNHEDHVGSFAQHMHLTVAAAKRAIQLQARDHFLEHLELEKVLARSGTYDNDKWEYHRLQLYCVIQPLGYQPEPRSIEPSEPWPRR